MPKAGMTDLREWMQRVESLGELKTIRGANWQEEIGVLTEHFQRSRPHGPAVVFDDIPGYPSGFRVLVNSIGGPGRLGLTLGLPTDLDERGLVEAWTNLAKDIKPVAMRAVTDGPVLENVLEGDDINLFKFPVPLWHEHDNGRYIGTGSVDITRDPDDGTINAGTYRVMVKDEKNAFFYVSPGKHGRIHRDKFFARGEACPIVVSVGHHPGVFLAGGIEVPYGVNELEWLGGLYGSPVEVVHGKHTGLPFPADAEIVIEGYAHPDRLAPEGPFGEWTGYYASDTRPEPILEVKAIYHRNNPIILGSPPAKPPTELSYYRAILRSSMIREGLQQAGIPDIRDVWCHECGASRLLVVVSITQRYPGHARQAALVAGNLQVANYLGRYVVVVDDDIDVYDLNDVMWALCTRSDPADSIEIIRRQWSGPLDPRVPTADKGHNSRAYIDATRPWEWRHEFPRVAKSSPELYNKVIARFRGDLG